jgi:hypothetical protein
MEGIESPYINRYGSRSIQEPESTNILSTTIPERTPQLMFDLIPSRTTSQTIPPPGGPPTLPKTTHTGPHEIIIVNQPLMKLSTISYSQIQKTRLKLVVDIKLSIVQKRKTLVDFPHEATDLNYLAVDHVFDVLDNLKGADRSRLRGALAKALNREIPYNKDTWDENTAALIKGIVDMEVIFDTNTPWDDIHNYLFM